MIVSKKGNQALKRSGHTTVEYAICLTLLGVLALASLKLLGGSITHLLGASNNTQTMTQTNQLFALIGANTNGGSSTLPISATTGPGNTPALATANTVYLQIDPTTGQAVITDTTGGSKNTTSVDGSSALAMMSKQLGTLADVKMANGQPLPSALQAQIRKLMMDGVGLSNAYNGSTSILGQFNAINTANTGKTSGFTTYPQAVLDTLGNNLNQGMQFQNDYNSLTTMLSSLAKTDPTLQARLIDPISQLAGGISNIPYNAYGKTLATDFNINAANTSGLIKLYLDNPLIATAIPLSKVIQTALLDPTSRDALMQSTLTGVVKNTLVGTLPTGSVSINLNMSNYTTASSSISGTSKATGTTPAVNINASISITTSGISATASSTAIGTPIKP